MIDLVILTGAYRLDNLKIQVKSIKNSLQKYACDFYVTWLICKDQYNAYGNLDIDLIFNEVSNSGMLFQAFMMDVGKPNQPNYGGDLFNEPVQWFLSNNPHVNPWFYILDDDNLMHPYIFRTLLRCQELSKRIIWMTKIRETGIVDQAIKETAFSKYILGDEYFIPTNFCADPSQLLIKGDLLTEVGGYGSGFKYDFEWCTPLCQKYIDEVAFYNNFDDNIDDIHCYHNGIRSKKEIEEIDSALKYDPVVEGHFQLSVDGLKPKIFPIRSELAKIIYNIVKRDYENNI